MATSQIQVGSRRRHIIRWPSCCEDVAVAHHDGNGSQGPLRRPVQDRASAHVELTAVAGALDHTVLDGVDDAALVRAGGGEAVHDVLRVPGDDDAAALQHQPPPLGIASSRASGVTCASTGTPYALAADVAGGAWRASLRHANAKPKPAARKVSSEPRRADLRVRGAVTIATSRQVSGMPVRVKNHKEAVSQSRLSVPTSVPPTTGRVQPGSPRSRRLSIFVA